MGGGKERHRIAHIFIFCLMAHACQQKTQPLRTSSKKIQMWAAALQGRVVRIPSNTKRRSTMKNRITFICAMLFLLSPLAHAKIVFAGGRMPEAGKACDIYVMNDDGSNLRKITNTPEGEGNPKWSPDGKYIAFTRDRPPHNGRQVVNIFMMDADGSNERRLTNHHALDNYPRFLPGGKQLCFLSLTKTESALYNVSLINS
ncbi:hypothetical protein C6503_23260 [Candidatus Poribacteria bacterium]|nr:MAG: hypothetical protein C6503_23260 [Candidatus Poribacteria bacterium]